MAPAIWLLWLCLLPARAQDAPGLTVWRGRAESSYTSPEYRVEDFDRAVMSWNATGGGTFELGVGDSWRVMGVWGEEPRSAKADGVDIDTLVLERPARSFRFRFTPAPGSVVTLVAVTRWMEGHPRPYSEERSAAWGKTIDVPARSQTVESKDPRDICSPTSLAMILSYYGHSLPTRVVADAVFDREARVYGDWPFNTAYAHRVLGRETFVRAGMDLRDLEEEIAAGRPVAIGHQWKDGELDGAPLPRVDGHVVVVVGFTRDGDVVVNDPAAPPWSVRRVYKRRQIYKTWMINAPGVGYLFR